MKKLDLIVLIQGLKKNNKVVINFITSDFDWLKSTILL